MKQNPLRYKCRICGQKGASFYQGICKPCTRTSEKRITSDNEKMVRWHQKEFGIRGAYKLMLKEEGITVLWE